MSNQPFSSAALRGAVDLSALRRPSRPGPGAPGAAGAAGASAGAGAAAGASGAAGAAGRPSAGGPVTQGYVVDATDATFQDLVAASVRYPVVLLLWSPRQRESVAFVDELAGLVRSYEGRLQLARINVEDNPGLVQAFMQGQLPMCVAFLQGRPVPLFGEPQPADVLRQVLDQLVQVAVQSGVTGRVPAGPADAPGGAGAPGGPGAAGMPGAPVEEPLPDTIRRAYEAIDAGDFDAAAAAFGEALADNPADEEARLGRAQVDLLRRTAGVDHLSARKAAAGRPDDVAAQILVADLDILGGHVDDAFARLVDTVRRTAGDDRSRAREHLLSLFDVVGASDERVVKARKALTAALF